MATLRILLDYFDFSATDHSHYHCISAGKPELTFPNSINVRSSLIKTEFSEHPGPAQVSARVISS